MGAREWAITAIVAAGVLAAPPASATTIDDAIELSWDGVHYAETVNGAFFDFASVAPDAEVARTLWVRNMGPSDAFLAADIVDVSLETDGSVALFGALELSWGTTSRTFDELVAAGETRFLDIPVARCASVPVTLTYVLPWEVVAANTAEVGAESASFDVRMTLTQDPADTDAPEPCSLSTSTSGGRGMAGTGSTLGPWLVVGATLIVVGLYLVVAIRRHTRADAVRSH